MPAPKSLQQKQREALSDLRQLAMELGYVPHPGYDPALAGRLRAAFGTTRAGYEAAGLPSYPHARKRKDGAENLPLPAKFVAGEWDDP